MKGKKLKDAQKYVLVIYSLETIGECLCKRADSEYFLKRVVRIPRQQQAIIRSFVTPLPRTHVSTPQCYMCTHLQIDNNFNSFVSISTFFPADMLATPQK